MSTIIASNVSDGTLSIPTTYVTNGSAKAWVNFNGTGTVSIRDSFNVSSLTDNGVGVYTVNFSNAFGAANYAVSGTSMNGNVMGPYTPSGAITASNVVILSWFTSFTDAEPGSVLAHGDLA